MINGPNIGHAERPMSVPAPLIIFGGRPRARERTPLEGPRRGPRRETVLGDRWL